MRLRTRTKSLWVKGNSRAGMAPGIPVAPMPSVTLRKVSFTAASELLPLVIARVGHLEAARPKSRRRRTACQTTGRGITQDRPLHRGRQTAQLIPLQPEAGHQLDQATGLILEAFRRSRSLLDQGCILLGDLIHL